MKVSAVLSFSAAAVMTANAESFSEPDQAIWVDRHNYFRTTGLPWSAGNMRRMGWDSALATKAASTAAKCSATTSTGINAYQSSSSNSSSIIDEAIQSWVVETAVSTVNTMAQPGTDGLDVGVGVYNSYSQVVWAATYSVGCATASCSGGDVVVCEYSPAGNDGKSAWYNHAAQASKCPDKTTASGGLCIYEGNDANNQIADIPAGESTYQVYPSFVSDIHSILIESAREIAQGSVPPTAQNLTSLSSTPAPNATTAAPTATKGTTTKAPKVTTSTSSSADSSSSGSSAAPMTQDDSNQAPGTVKASSATGSTFRNEAKTPSSQETTQSEGDSSTTKQTTESLTTSTGQEGASSHSMTTLGMVSMFILGIAAVAGIVMFVHYRVSTKRQNDILLDGGIHNR
uniref:SCP domain-containing protein n=2 Tax=Phytophthora ramorum TaxID=164328 RepID=H3GDN3_PHYRM